MRSFTRTLRRAAVAAAALTLAATPAMAASSTPSSSPTDSSSGSSGSGKGAAPGTSFLTAGKAEMDSTSTATASTGEYMYWSFPALSGQDVTAKVTLKFPTQRSAASTWRVDVFDGIRRHQPCAAGHPQNAAAPTATEVKLDCGPRTIRPWSEAWASDPLPGTYYVRVAATDLSQKDVGLKVDVTLELSAEGGGDIGPDAGQDDALKAPLVPITRGGQVLQPGQVADTRKVTMDGFDNGDDRWLSGTTGRWVWTVGAGITAMLLGVGGYMFARHPRRWFR